LSVKKSKVKGKSTAKPAAKTTVRRASGASSGTRKKPVDISKVREKISDLVGGSAKDIANEVIKVAKTGQLASAKYLFEAVGLFPPAEHTMPRAKEDSLAHTLLRRLGLPLEPVSGDEEESALVMDESETSCGKTADENREKETVAAEGDG
jgi:hypothetical protein